jgi:hypothetical protein
MTNTIDPVASLDGPRAAGVCAPSAVTLTATAIPLGTLPGWHAGVNGIAVDDTYVYATHGYSGTQNGHDTPQFGELVVFGREALRTALHAGAVPPERRITVGKQPRAVASLVQPDYERVFVVNYHQDSYSVTVLDRRTWAVVAETKTGMTPIDIAVHAGRGRAYLTDAYHGIRVLDARTGAELPDEHIDIERELIGVAVDEASDTLFVAHSTQYFAPPIDQLVIVDLKTRTITHRVPFRAHSNPVDVDYDAAAGTAYVRMIGPVNDGNQFGLLAVRRTAPTAPPGVLVATGGGRGVVAGSGAAGGWVYATTNGRLEVFDPAGRERVASVLLAPLLGPVAVDRLTGEIYAGDLVGGRLFRVVPVVEDSPIGQLPQVQDGTLGAPLDAPGPGPDGEALVQRFQHGLAVATADYGAVAVRHGHDTTWLDGSPARGGGPARLAAAAGLGNPVMGSTTVGGVPVTYFENGAIVTRTDLGFPVDVVVSGAVWQRYAEGGDVSGGYGLPLGPEVAADRGGHQQFDNAVLFHRGDGSPATVVWRGPVWDTWNAGYGGVAGHLGFPSADLVRTYEQDTGQQTAEWLEMENGALVWNGGTGAVYRLYEQIWRDWQVHGGAGGLLGLPLTDSLRHPEDPASAVHYADFDGGVLVLYPLDHPMRPADGSCRLARSLRLFITGFTAWESDGPGGPLPDPYVDHWLVARFGAADPHVRWDGRLPSANGNWEEVNEVPWEPRAVELADRVRGDLGVNLAFHCWDSDDVEDDKLGEVERSYTIDNFWGLDPAEPEEHHAETDEGSFSAFYRMMPLPEPIDLSGNFRGRYFWQFRNPDTERLGKDSYSQTFTDVEAGFQFGSLDPRDWVREGFEAAFYHLFFKKVAAKGNCFGMSAEAAEALRDRSSFSQPLYAHGHPRLDLTGDLFGTPDMSDAGDVEMMRRLNLRQASQLGDRVVRWVATRIMETLRGGAIDDATTVWQESKLAWERGDWPVLAMPKEWRTSSHAVLPYRWTELDNGEREIWIADPSKPPLMRDPDDVSDGLERIRVLPDGSWGYYRYVDGVWSPVGSYNSGTPRWLVWIPRSVYAGQHKLPSVQALLDIVLHGVATWAVGSVVGGDADVQQISDASGRTLYAPDLPHPPASPADMRTDPGGVLPGVYPIPLIGAEDEPVDGQFHYAVGRHDVLAHDIVPRHAGGTYVWALRHGPVAASVVAPTDAHPDRIQAEEIGGAGRSVRFSRGKTLPPKVIDMMVEAFPRMPLPRHRAPAADRTRQYLLEELTVAGGQQVVARPANGGAELRVSSYGAPATFALRMRGRSGTALSRVRRITVERDRTVVLRPAGWTVEALDAAPLPVEVRESPDGPRIRCYEVTPEGPPEV